MIEVVAALIRKGDSVLICKRSEKQSRAGKWEFPGGKVEPGETPEEALARECREELAVETAIGELVSDNTCVYPDISIRLSLYEARIMHGTPLALEHADCRYVRICSLYEYPFCEADIPFLAAIQGLPEQVL